MSLKQRFDYWIASWLDMICGLISVITLCFYRPWWDFMYRTWADKKRLRKKLQSSRG